MSHNDSITAMFSHRNAARSQLLSVIMPPPRSLQTVRGP